MGGRGRRRPGRVLPGATRPRLRCRPPRVALYGEPRRLSPNTEVAEEMTQGTSDETDEKARN